MSLRRFQPELRRRVKKRKPKVTPSVSVGTVPDAHAPEHHLKRPFHRLVRRGRR